MKVCGTAHDMYSFDLQSEKLKEKKFSAEIYVFKKYRFKPSKGAETGFFFCVLRAIWVTKNGLKEEIELLRKRDERTSYITAPQ